jgi:hypothetical protein
MDATQVKAWRRQERTRLIAMRMGIPPAARREWGALGASAVGLGKGFITSICV